MSRTIVDIHIIQTLPPSNVNRDDTGSPKTAVFGGVRRARVSSQAWKRSTRVDFASSFDASDLGVRTKRVVELLADEIRIQAPDLADKSIDMATDVFKAAGIELTKPRKNQDGLDEAKYLILLGRRQVEALAREVIASLGSENNSKIDKKMVHNLLRKGNSIDLALFGRMVADVSDGSLNVDAAVQVAHALSVHAVDNEYDYFTAIDELKDGRNGNGDTDDTGAGMIGTVEFNSSTLYRYATIDVNELQGNLADPDVTRRAVTAFISSFVKSMPTGKQNTFANRTLPDAIMIIVRNDQPVSLVGAFEDPIRDGSANGRVRQATKQLAQYAMDVANAYASPSERAWVTGVGDRAKALEEIAKPLPFDQLLAALDETLTERLTDAR